MPELTWPTKSIQNCHPPSLTLDSIVFPHGKGFPGEIPEDHLYLADNFALMTGLLDKYEGKVDLIYADPPFFTNKRFPARIGRGEDSRQPASWLLAEGYNDSWENLDAYLDFLYPRLALIHRLLSPRGTFYLHLDWHANAYARILLDELFGPEHLINEIIWTYHGPSPIRRAFNRKHDTILAFAKSEKYIFNHHAVRKAYDPSTVKTFASSPKAGFGKKPDLERGKVPEDWWYFPVMARLHNERTGYPTQKPAALMERILLASSNPGSLVADFFCGSGSFPTTAAKHGRHFLASDITWRAIHTTRNRLVETANAPFTVHFSGGQPFPSISTHSVFSASLANSVVSVSPGDMQLDYWEVDPNWNSEVFYSRCQVCRPKRTGKIPLQIKMPAEAGNIRVRAVTIEGLQMEGDVYTSNR